MKKLLLRLLCHFDGGHRFYLDDLHRCDDMHVTGLCHRCERAYVAPCGLSLPGRLYGFRKDVPALGKETAP